MTEILDVAEALRLHEADDAQPPQAAEAVQTATDETALAARFVSGDASAFDEVVALYQSRVERLAHRLLSWRGAGPDVDDAVQDVFLAALSNARKFRGTRGLWPWLATITVNACRTQRRRAWVRDKLLWSRSRLSAETSPAADAGSEQREAVANVRRAIDRIGAIDREVIVLHCLEEMPIANVANVLGITHNAVQVRLHRARQRLRRELDK